MLYAFVRFALHMRANYHPVYHQLFEYFQKKKLALRPHREKATPFRCPPIDRRRSPGIQISAASALNRCVSTSTSVDFALLHDTAAEPFRRLIFGNSYKTGGCGGGPAGSRDLAIVPAGDAANKGREGARTLVRSAHTLARGPSSRGTRRATRVAIDRCNSTMHDDTCAPRR
jgi:hypothetical protein